jgi:hypothetical protein
MAEIAFATVASAMGVASLALQISDIIQRLYVFWSSVKDASKEVGVVVQELHLLRTTLNLMAVEYERSTLQETHLQPTKAGLRLCQLRVQELDSLLNELDKASSTTKDNRWLWKSLKVVLRQELITKFLIGLDRAKLTLLLVDQHYFRLT